MEVLLPVTHEIYQRKMQQVLRCWFSHTVSLSTILKGNRAKFATVKVFTPREVTWLEKVGTEMETGWSMHVVLYTETIPLIIPIVWPILRHLRRFVGGRLQSLWKYICLKMGSPWKMWNWELLFTCGLFSWDMWERGKLGNWLWMEIEGIRTSCHSGIAKRYISTLMTTGMERDM